ncbi:MAG: peptidoglycan bridge formation glycyltransferase FemA/FemB family protein [Patescibacteria group bacterium]
MRIKEIKNKKEWESFLSECSEKTFLQSWNWGEFQKEAEGGKIWRIGVFEENELIAISLIVLIKAKRGSFLFLPHGPVIKYQLSSIKYQVLKTLLKELRKISKEEKVDFIRISPIWERNKDNIRIFKDLGFRDAVIHVHPELTWELKIDLPEEELLDGMRKTTRYLIKKATKDVDIEILKSQNLQDVEKFYNVYKTTAKRHHFVPFNRDYLDKEFSAFHEDNEIVIFLGKYKGEVVSSAMMIYWQQIGFYHQGASLIKYSKIPVSYLLQWKAILEGKKRECSIYNFWGIAPENAKKHPWAGLSLFKKGFSGYKKLYVKTQDFPITKKYCLTRIFEKIRKIKRRL